MCDNRLEIGKKLRVLISRTAVQRKIQELSRHPWSLAASKDRLGGGGGVVAGGCGPSALRLLLRPLCWVMTYRQVRGWWPVPGSRVLDFDPRASSLAFIPHPQTSETGAPFCSLIAPKSLMHHSGL